MHTRSGVLLSQTDGLDEEGLVARPQRVEGRFAGVQVAWGGARHVLGEGEGLHALRDGGVEDDFEVVFCVAGTYVMSVPLPIQS